MTRDEVIKKLDHLIEACQDGEDGYYVASQGVQSPRLKTVLEQYSNQRGEFADQLAEIIVSMGGSLDVGSGPANVLAFRWEKLKTAINAGNVAALLHECEHCDARALRAYLDLLAIELPDHVRAIVHWQHETLKRSHRQLRRYGESGFRQRRLH